MSSYEKLKTFYERYFQATANAKYSNSKKGFSSYFLRFHTGTRLEVMQMDSVKEGKGEDVEQFLGYAHLAFSVGSTQKVDDLTSLLKEEGFQVIDGPRRTGDGYYESVVLDPEGNRIEITV